MELTIEQALLQGVAAHKKGNFQDAERLYRAVLQSQPLHPDANHNLGLIEVSVNKADLALPLFKSALETNPKIEQFWLSYIDALIKDNQINNAKRVIKKAKKKGFSSAKLDALAAKSYSKTQAANVDKSNPSQQQLNTLLKYFQTGQYGDAEKLALSITQKFPQNPFGWKVLGALFGKSGRNSEAENASQKAVSLSPEDAEAHYNLGKTLVKLGKLEEAFASYSKATELKVDYSDAYSNKNLCLNYSSLWSPLLIYKQHLEFEKQFGGLKIEAPLSLPLKKDFGKRLRIGYVSSDFRNHSVAYFFEPLLQHHSGHVVETFCYYNNSVVDAMTKRLMATCDHWRSIYGIADPEVANLIRNDKIDILVDLSGHTAGNRLLLFAQKPAHIQVTWLGYPNTTGLSAIDYRFTDIIADPRGEADELHSETLLRLPNGFQCYQGNEKAHVGIELSQKSRGHITFGSFNNLSKMTPQVIKTWAKILHEVPASHLLLKGSSINNNKNHYLELFKQEGIAEDRIEYHGHLPSMDDHLKLYSTIDIGLDPFPFNGATTTCEALWMGVPVITLLGDRHVGRVGASILTNVGLTGFIAQDIDGYIQLAVEMAANPTYLQEIRRGLRKRMLDSPLCDGSSFASDIEKAYQDMWQACLK